MGAIFGALRFALETAELDATRIAREGSRARHQALGPGALASSTSSEWEERHRISETGAGHECCRRNAAQRAFPR
jgi:hypothetical protein